MALDFSHAVGYRGVCKLRKQLLLCTGGNINLTQDPIMSSGVWGAGYANIAPIAYAWNYLQTEGSANFELTTGGVWSTLRDFGVAARTSESDIQLLPDGVNGFKGKGWCSSLSFDASEGSAITGSFNFKGDPSGGSRGGIVANEQEDESETGTSQAGSTLAGATLIPYWQTKVDTFEDIISWNCSYNSDLQLLKCCNLNSQAPLSADYILAGQMTADASLTVFKIKGQFDPTQYHQAKTFKAMVGSESQYIQIPKVILNSASTSMTTGASYVTAEFSYTGLGDGTNSIFTMSGGSSGGDSSSTGDGE